MTGEVEGVFITYQTSSDGEAPAGQGAQQGGQELAGGSRAAASTAAPGCARCSRVHRAARPCPHADMGAKPEDVCEIEVQGVWYGQLSA